MPPAAGAGREGRVNSDRRRSRDGLALKIARVDLGPEFAVARRRAGDAVVVVPEGEIDLATVDGAPGRARRRRRTSADAGGLLDLRGVTFIDSAGVRLVLEGMRALAAAGGEMVVVPGATEVWRVFGLVGLDGRVRMVDGPPDE